MKVRLPSFNTQQTVLAVVTGLVLFGAILAARFVVPAVRQWQDLRVHIEEQTLEFAKLSRNLEVKQSVDRQFATLKPEIWQTESDEIKLSQFLRQLDPLARLPGITPINAKPLPIEDKGTHKIYRVRVSFSGQLPDVLKFVTDLTNGDQIVGLESFALRGIAGGGGNQVECTIQIWTVCLVKEPAKPADDGRRGPRALRGRHVG